MRRTKKEIKKLRLKIIELKKEGKDYEDIRRITGASPNTISKVLKGFTGRYCQKCGETNPEVLEEHHPDKENKPNWTITLCANCHEEITRKQARERQKIKNEIQPIISQQSQLISYPFILQQPKIILPEKENENKNLVAYSYSSPILMTPEDGKMLCFSLGGIACIIESITSKRKPFERVLLLIGSAICFWQAYKKWKEIINKC